MADAIHLNVAPLADTCDGYEDLLAGLMKLEVAFWRRARRAGQPPGMHARQRPSARMIGPRHSVRSC